MRATAVAFLMLALAGPAAAQMGDQAEPVCTGTAPALPAELAGWGSKAPVKAAASGKAAAKARLVPGRTAEAALLPTPRVAYPVRPAKPGGSVSHGGLLGFTVAQAGTYRVALASGAWIEVLRHGKPVMSSAHGRGPACTGVRKMVDFPLQPGEHLLEIAGNGTPSLGVLVTRLP